MFKWLGFTFLETLTSLFLLSLVLLGLQVMHFHALQNSQAGIQLISATIQLNNLSDQFMGLHNPTEISTIQTNWNIKNQINLPNSKGIIIGVFPKITAMLTWGRLKHICKENQMGLSGCLRENLPVDFHSLNYVLP